MKILFLGAHTDDIEHGAGGTLSRFLEEEATVKYITFSLCKDIPRNKYIGKDQDKIKDYLKKKGVDISMLDFTNRFLFKESHLIREKLENIKNCFNPDFIFTHWEKDLHQDHQVVFLESYRVFKHSSLISYQCVPSCPNFFTNYFVKLEDRHIQAKLKMLKMYKTQQLYYNNADGIESLAKIRGMEIKTKYAEGFNVLRRII